jgi:hypothetical protein
MKAFVALVGLMTSSAVWADTVQATSGAIVTESPRNMVFELRLGPYSPLVDRAFPNLSVGPYQQTFGTGFMLLAEGEIERQLWQKVGSLAVGLSVGYTEKYAHATADVGGGQTGEAVSLRLVPMKVLAVYRFDFLQIKYGIPLVPFVKAGIEVAYWLTAKGTQSPETTEGVAGQGVSYGFVGMAGMAFLLDVLDPRLARDFDSGIGVNHSYIFAEFNFAEVNDFDRKNAAGTPNALDLSSRFVMFGLAFEY